MSEIAQVSFLIFICALGCAFNGVGAAWALHSFHEQPVRVGLGAAIRAAVFVVLVAWPTMMIQGPGENIRQLIVATLGVLFCTALDNSNLMSRLPLVGGPTRAYRLALKRQEELRIRRDDPLIAKLQAERGYVFPRK